MKKLFIITLLSITVFTAEATITIQTAVNFGAFSKGCKGGGFCRASTKTSAGVTAATFQYDNTAPGKLNVIIDEAQLAQIPGDIAASLRAGRFVQEENWELPADVTAALSLSGTYNIPKGTYTATTAGGKVTITLSIARPVAAR